MILNGLEFRLMKKEDISVLIPVMKRAFDDARLFFKKQQAVRLVMTMEVFLKSGVLTQMQYPTALTLAKERLVQSFCLSTTSISVVSLATCLSTAN